MPWRRSPLCESTGRGVETPLLLRRFAHQENALVKFAELYRDQKNAQGVAEVINMSRSFMSSTAKAKTAKLINISKWKS
ncbi:unnamed protein product [Somion occarium]|uniref:26S proteasome regulatory subunit Rpn6 N-terminal domain-containing protein n=1 Tax=Somion occarium TaxID=3059160 RepID=A0ABP1DDA6_9APHY